MFKMAYTRLYPWSPGFAGGTELGATRLNNAFQEIIDYAELLSTRAVQTSGGGREDINTIASSGSAVTLDLTLGNVQDITLTANAVSLTLTGQISSKACSVTAFFRQDSIGGRSISPWPTSILWPGNNEPIFTTVPNGFDVVNFVTLDGGTSWMGFHGTTAHWEADPGFAIDDAIETEDRMSDVNAATVPGLASGLIYLSYFRARKTLTCSRIGMVTGSVPAAATPTLVRIGFYSIDSNKNLTLECESDNLASGGCVETNSSAVVTSNVRFGANQYSEYVAPLSSAHLGLPTTYTFHTGHLYAQGIIVLSSAAMPNFYGSNVITKHMGARWPRFNGTLSGRTDLEASISNASQGFSTSHFYGLGLV